MWRSSSETISRGEKSAIVALLEARCAAWAPLRRASAATVETSLELFDDHVGVGIDADVGGDLHRLACHRFGVEALDVDQRARRGQCVVAARADADQPVLGLQH